jgi:hypothetical protein
LISSAGALRGFHRTFGQRPRAFFKFAEAKLAEIRAEKARIETILGAQVEDVPICDPAEVLRVEAKMKTFAAEFARQTEAQREKDDRKQKEIAQRALEHRYNVILAEYRAYSFEPIRVDGKPICLSLARAIGAKLQRIGEPQS